MGVTSSGQYYGGDGSGSFMDYLHRVVYETDQYNPIALVWDGIKGNVNGSDRYGNELSGFDSNLKIASAVPITKVGSILTTTTERIIFSEVKMVAKTGVNAVEQVAVHGNSLSSLKPTWGYKLYSADGTFLKNGITSKAIPEKRYTKGFMFDKHMPVQIQFPNRFEAWKWEFQQNQILRGPLNKNMH